MIFLYNIGIKFYLLATRLAAVFGHAKAKLWVDGRKNIFAELEEKIKINDQIIWFHAASLGEFEQGRPLIEKIKAEYPAYRILLTFYSPSGYQIRKNYPQADIVCYLPVDSHQNAKRFLEIVRPTLVVFIKYEFWYHYLKQAIDSGTRVIYIAALFRPQMIYFGAFSETFSPIFRKISHFFVQNTASKDTLLQKVAKINPGNIAVAGDPRIDRVLEIASTAQAFPILEQFSAGKNVLIAGSTWEKDIEILKNWRHFSDWKLIVAPHEIKEKNIADIENRWGTDNCLRYSMADNVLANSASVLIIDNIGMLSSIYRYGKIAYIGGGFGSGIHNTLEPMAFGIPVIFGPKYGRFEEACRMVEQGGAFSVATFQEFAHRFEQLTDTEQYNTASTVVKNYMQANRGASSEILQYCRKIL